MNLDLNYSFIKQNMPWLMKKRQMNAHKGDCGSVAVIGGAPGMQGAVILAATTALKSGCGKVFFSLIQKENVFSDINRLAELMQCTVDEMFCAINRTNALVIGCGLGLSLAAEQCLEKFLFACCCPIVIDADALNLIAQKRFIVSFSPKRHILTPHPAEAARLLGISTQMVQQDRVAAIKRLAEKYHATIVLKGPHTLVYSPVENDIYINPSGNCALATAGSGDVLSGLIGGLLAQGFPVLEAAKAGVFLHGLAADYWCQKHGGPIGLIASELADIIRLLRNRIAYLNLVEKD